MPRRDKTRLTETFVAGSKPQQSRSSPQAAEGFPGFSQVASGNELCPVNRIVPLRRHVLHGSGNRHPLSHKSWPVNDFHIARNPHNHR